MLTSYATLSSSVVPTAQNYSESKKKKAHTMIQRYLSKVIIEDKTTQGIFAQFWFTQNCFFSSSVCVNAFHLTLSPHHPY